MKLLKWPLRLIYGAWCWLIFLACALVALNVMLVMPGLERRRWIARFTARAVFAAWGVKLKVSGTDRLPAERCIVVANHASYLDGLVLSAALPPRFAFVIKKEMDRVPLASLLLRRIGSEFVDRHNRHKGAMDARRVLRTASNGQSLVFFPEGTFSTQPGLLRFHTGAFATAVRAGCTLFPVVIRGTRTVLSSRAIIPTPASIMIDVLATLEPQPGNPEAAAQLRDTARRIMLAHLGEPDLDVATQSPPLEMKPSRHAAG
ncbi:MAG TPA: lysophospholipid acyltransferase family protein [Steroidobacteraceae bacterium]|nr:lysophospholipid acyltransferase family protein [Steroidobacteraceae bacterium]